jgi:hypothetical protein
MFEIKKSNEENHEGKWGTKKLKLSRGGTQ